MHIFSLVARETHFFILYYFYSHRCFRGPLHLPSGWTLRGLESQFCGGESPSEKHRSKLRIQRQPGGSVQPLHPFIHHRRDTGGASQSWPQRPWCGGGSLQRLLQVGLQQERDQLSLLRVDICNLSALAARHVVHLNKQTKTHICTRTLLYSLFCEFYILRVSVQ